MYHLVHPHIGGHHLVLEVHIDKLRELESELDGEGLCEVGDRSDEAVVVMEEVVIQPLGVRVALHTCLLKYIYFYRSVNGYVHKK